MKNPTLKSYLVPIDVAEPKVSINSKILNDAPTAVQHWHQSIKTIISVSIEIDIEKILQETSLKYDAELGVYATAYSRLTKLKTVSPTYKIDPEGLEFTLTIDERTAGGYLSVEVVLICLNQGTEPSQLSPVKFDVLTSWKYVVELEGDNPRANVQLVNFDGLKEKALWEVASTPPEDIDDWKFASISSVIQVNLSNAFYARLQTDPIFQLQYCVDFMWEALLLSTQSEEILSEILTESKNAPGSLIKTCHELIRAVFGNQNPLYSDVLHYVQNKPSHVRAILQDRAARVLRIKL